MLTTQDLVKSGKLTTKENRCCSGGITLTYEMEKNGKPYYVSISNQGNMGMKKETLLALLVDRVNENL